MFMKYPEPGRVKTRLGQEVGMERAAVIYRKLTIAVLTHLPTDADLVVYGDPPDAALPLREWISGFRTDPFEVLPQPQTGLGGRLAEGFGRLFGMGYERVAAIGTDCPEIEPELFTDTWKHLSNHEVVLGPAADGGYYLIGLSQPRPELFAGIDWSTEKVMGQTLHIAEKEGWKCHLLPERRDVDHAADWERFAQAGEGEGL